MKRRFRNDFKIKATRENADGTARIFAG